METSRDGDIGVSVRRRGDIGFTGKRRDGRWDPCWSGLCVARSLVRVAASRYRENGGGKRDGWKKVEASWRVTGGGGTKIGVIGSISASR